MQKTTLKKNSVLYGRPKDEVFQDVDSILEYCQDRKDRSSSARMRPEQLHPIATSEGLMIPEGDALLPLTDWSFGQLCSLAGVDRRTVNRVRAETAARIFQETLPQRGPFLQTYRIGDTLESIHGSAYTRLFNADVVKTVLETAEGFDRCHGWQGSKSGLYCGPQDLFLFLTDQTDGWTEIEGEQFAPGFFVWNSEVGKTTVGIQSFWFQKSCCNHWIFGVTDVSTSKRRHTAGVWRGLSDIRYGIQRLIDRRDERKDRFVVTMRKAMTERFSDSETAQKAIQKAGFTQKAARVATEDAHRHGGLTVYRVIDALTRAAQDAHYTDQRTQLDRQAGSLLSLVM